MKNVLLAQGEALRKHHAKFACSHESKSLRRRAIKGGTLQYVYQCVRCGEVSLQAVARAKAYELCGGNEPPPLDAELAISWKQTKKEAQAKVAEAASNEFWSGYTAYLASPAWSSKRRQVLERATGKCEGCREQIPAEVHHLSYDHVGQEFLFELVAVCHACHERLHPKANEPA